ncbi:MAG: hypothetical protein KAS61_07245, partial [Spirochaetes bacterium]|nr:hypothetical protein [Spirochaetota bacterium]
LKQALASGVYSPGGLEGIKKPATVSAREDNRVSFSSERLILPHLRAALVYEGNEIIQYFEKMTIISQCVVVPSVSIR